MSAQPPSTPPPLDTDIDHGNNVIVFPSQSEVSPTVEGGKRQRKAVNRLSYTHPSPKAYFTPSTGSGQPVGEIENICYNLDHELALNLKWVHKIFYGNANVLKGDVKKNLRLFSGLTDTSEKALADKTSELENYTLSALKELCVLLDLSSKGSKNEKISRVVDFLKKPQYRGNKSIKQEKLKKRAKSSSGKAEKKAGANKSKKDKVKRGPNAWVLFVQAKRPSLIEEDPSLDITQVSSMLSETWKGMNDQEKAPFIEQAKKAKESLVTATSDKDESSDDELESPIKKKSTSNTKKRKNDDSDDDKPLAKTMKKSKVTDSEIKKLIQKVLKTADLQKVTKRIIRNSVQEMVGDDLSSRKETIDNLIASEFHRIMEAK